MMRCVQTVVVAQALACFLAAVSSAQDTAPPDTLAGPLPAVVKDKGRPYVVASDIEVPPDKMVTIEPGVILLFKNFTGLHVEGRLVAEGTKTRPIIFTSELDGEHNKGTSLIANPYDWNGIYLHQGALGSSLAQCEVKYSVYGIVSDTKFIRIVSALFRDNGKSNLVIAGQEQPVGSEPHSYVLSTKDATVDGVPVKILEDPLAVRRNVVRYTGLSALLGGCGVGVLRVLQLKKSRDRLEDLSQTDEENLITNSSQEWEKAQRQRNEDLGWTAAGFGIGLVGAIGFTWAFTF